VSIDDEDWSESGEIAEQFKRFGQRLVEIDADLGRLDEKIREAERKSEYVIRKVAPMFDDA
jgi:hypothetical protein